MIGRKEEIKRIQYLLKSKRSEFLAVTGRRRVGKTFLVDTTLRTRYCFSMTGIQNGDMAAQLVNFAVKLSEYNGTFDPVIPKNWQMAFLQLKLYLKTLDPSQKHVLFIDELPWVATARAGFIQFLAHFWNDYLSKEKHFILVICGSATSWITKKIVNDTGGLHNRVTELIHLKPFTLSETHEFLKTKGLRLSSQKVAKLYMSLGGIPFYLENLRKGESFAVAIERMCFAPNGLLKNEYNNLYQALFNHADIHQAIVEALAKHPYGLNHAALLQALGMKKATGSYQRALEELLVSDFVIEQLPFGKKKKGVTYRLVDQYSIFYHRFIQKNKKYTKGIWQQLAASQSYKIWTGYAFELLCHQHIDAIKTALGIPSVYTEIYSLYVPTADKKGFQIDLIIDRKDDSINLCEIKFHAAPFAIHQAAYQRLLQKRQAFIEYTQTKKQVFLSFISNHPLVDNAYAAEIVDVAVVLEDLLD